jgi:hypothetical protein
LIKIWGFPIAPAVLIIVFVTEEHPTVAIHPRSVKGFLVTMIWIGPCWSSLFRMALYGKVGYWDQRYQETYRT